MKYIALLRGINVSGKNSLKMNDLQAILTSIGCYKCLTYLQSGNAFVETGATDALELETNIEEAIRLTVGLQIVVIVRTAEEWKRLVEQNPLLQQKHINQEKLHVTLLKSQPSDEVLNNATFKNDDGEQYHIIGREVYLYCPNGYGRTKLTNSAFESKLKVSATTRNWNTMSKLTEMLKE